mmetsp:Transcript_39286/g.94997  ORF Transcript_39286/g.94997 Transcript_39286/m.94997 type:complete len:264 (+) Transcript_39286:133-924(+)
MDTKNNIEEPVPVTVTDSAAAATGPDDGDGVDGGGNTSATGGDHVDVVNNMVPKSVPWASVKVSPEDESIIQEVDDIKNACYFLMPDWKTRQSKFWLLLILACIIAAAGVVGDSAATVIGAMIVAPLMMPIQGLMVSTVLLDKNNWFFSSFMVLAGVGSSICIGAIFGAIMNESQFTKENNTEVSSRINPALTDLLGALATGTVGAIALVCHPLNHLSPSQSRTDLPCVWLMLFGYWSIASRLSHFLFLLHGRSILLLLTILS